MFVSSIKLTVYYDNGLLIDASLYIILSFKYIKVDIF